MKLSVLYRGLLSSCNYACGYCPFAKRTETESQLARDQSSVRRFAGWLGEQSGHRWRVLFTPWGEALVRAWYREVVAALTHVPHVDSVAIQSNLSCGMDWLPNCRTERLAFWATFHPTEANRAAFLRKVERVREAGAAVSVGVVGVPEFADHITSLRRELPSDVYLWINAQQPRKRPYSKDELSLFLAIDPHFELTVHRHRSLDQPCATGERVFTIDGKGDMRRCHFVDDIIGNIYVSDWESALRRRNCPKRFCNCYLGLAQLEPLGLGLAFGERVLERMLPIIS